MLSLKLNGVLSAEYIGRWVPCEEALPPERMGVLIIATPEHCPRFAWLRYSGGEDRYPFFVCSDLAATEVRGACAKDEIQAVTHWYSPVAEGLPFVDLNKIERSEKGLVGKSTEDWWMAYDFDTYKTKIAEKPYPTLKNRGLITNAKPLFVTIS